MRGEAQVGRGDGGRGDGGRLVLLRLLVRTKVRGAEERRERGGEEYLERRRERAWLAVTPKWLSGDILRHM